MPYIKEEFSTERAQVTAQKVIKSYMILADFPKRGKSADQLHEMLLDYYYLPLSQNTIFYKITSENQLLILRIYSNREDSVKKFLRFMED